MFPLTEDRHSGGEVVRGRVTILSQSFIRGRGRACSCEHKKLCQCIMHKTPVPGLLTFVGSSNPLLTSVCTEETMSWGSSNAWRNVGSLPHWGGEGGIFNFFCSSSCGLLPDTQWRAHVCWLRSPSNSIGTLGREWALHTPLYIGTLPRCRQFTSLGETQTGSGH